MQNVSARKVVRTWCGQMYRVCKWLRRCTGRNFGIHVHIMPAWPVCNCGSQLSDMQQHRRCTMRRRRCRRRSHSAQSWNVQLEKGRQNQRWPGCNTGRGRSVPDYIGRLSGWNSKAIFHNRALLFVEAPTHESPRCIYWCHHQIRPDGRGGGPHFVRWPARS